MAKKPAQKPHQKVRAKKSPGKSKEARTVARKGELSIQRQRFADEYLVDGNATQAAIRAGYSAKTAASQGERLLRNVEVAEYLKARREVLSERTMITTERVLQEVARIAFFDARKLFDANGNPLPINQLDDDTAAAISGLKVVTIGNSEIGYGEIREYKTSSKDGALDKLMKHLGLFAADNKQKNPLGDLPREVLKLMQERLLKLQKGD